MPFQKGQKPPPGAGRPKGSKNKKRVPLVSEYLGSKGINPTNEILKLIPSLDADQKLNAWKTLLSHTQPRVSEISLPPAAPEVSESVAPTSQLLSLVKGGSDPSNKTGKNGA